MTGLNLKLKITRGNEVSYLRCFSWKDAGEMTARIERQYAQRCAKAISLNESGETAVMPHKPVVKVLNVGQRA